MSEERKRAGLVAPEMMNPQEGLPAFFGWAEKTHPQGVHELVGVIRSLMPESGKAVTEREIREGLTDPDLDMGFNVLSTWLGKVTGKGFRDIGWPMDEVFLKGAKATKGIIFPAKEKVSGREVQETLKSFSATMKKAEANRMRPITIVGGLLQESVGSKLTNNGSITLRGELARALGGDQNLRWLRGALEIKDVAETKPAVEPKPLVETARAVTEKAELPAFLEGDKLLEGYEAVNLPPQKKQLIQLGVAEGSETIIYVGSVGVRLRRSTDRMVDFTLPGLGLPEDIFPFRGEKDAVGLTNIGSGGIGLKEGGFDIRLGTWSSTGEMRGIGYWNNVSLLLPKEVQGDGDKKTMIPDFGLLGPLFEIKGGNIIITNSSVNDLRLVVPSAARAERGAESAEAKTENWDRVVKKLVEDPFAQITYEQTQSIIAAAAAYSLNAEISNGSVGEEQFIGLMKRIAALSQNIRPKKVQPQLSAQWPAHQHMFLEDGISKTAYEATGSIVAAAAAFSLREEIMAGTIGEEKFVPLVREVAALVQKTRSQTKH